MNKKMIEKSKIEIESRNCRYSKGQAMLLIVLVLGGSLIGASTISGYLMLSNIRRSSDIANSTGAIYAADSGVEWDLYRRFKDSNYPRPQFLNGEGFNVTSTPSSTKSIGTVSNSNIFRAFEVAF